MGAFASGKFKAAKGARLDPAKPAGRGGFAQGVVSRTVIKEQLDSTMRVIVADHAAEGVGMHRQTGLFEALAARRGFGSLVGPALAAGKLPVIRQGDAFRALPHQKGVSAAHQANPDANRGIGTQRHRQESPRREVRSPCLPSRPRSRGRATPSRCSRSRRA